MRRFLILFIVLVVLGGAVWFFFFRTKQTATTPNQGGIFQSLFPLVGNNIAPDVSDDQTTEPSPVMATPYSPFKQLTSQPVAGVTAFSTSKVITIPAANPKLKPTKQTVVEHFVRYVGRTNGYVYEIKDGGTPTQISNIYIPNVYEALFADGGGTALLRFLRDDDQTIATYSVPIPEPNPDNTRTQKDGVYLPDNIFSLAVSTDSKGLARLTRDATSTILSTSDTRGGTAKEIIRSPFSEWLVSSANQSMYLQTKASATVEGFLYRVNTIDKRLVRVLGDVTGLTTSVSPKGTYMLYSRSAASSFTTFLFTTKTGTTKSLSLSILPEKCVWLKDENLICAGNDSVAPLAYPDTWYAGTSAFSDKLYRIYTSAGIVDTLNDGSIISFDAINLAVDEDQSLLYFIDKQTGLLWQYQY